MKKIWGILIVGLFLNSCASGVLTGNEVTLKTSDGRSYTYEHKDYWHGKNNFGECMFDSYWYEMATSYMIFENYIPRWAVADCYAKFETHRLCLEWDWIYMAYGDAATVMHLRGAVADALIVKKEDPLKCRNLNQDAQIKADREIDKAKVKATAARIKAQNAEAAAAAAKQNKQ